MTAPDTTRARNAGLVLPRGPRPGQAWRPRTEDEQHLLEQATRLDQLRERLLAEVGKLRHELSLRTRRRARLQTGARTTDRLTDCPLTEEELGALAAVAAGEIKAATTSRLLISEHTVTNRRQRAISGLEARTITHAVAIAVDAGWITSEQIAGGVTP